MPSQRPFDMGLLAGVLLSLGGNAGNWLITPMSHPTASSFQHAWEIGQFIGCTVAALWLIMKMRPRKDAAPAL